MDLEAEFIRAAALVRAGEWTSYSDISTAVTGDGRRARAVGRAAATAEGFPNAHRVLTSSGSISRPVPESDPRYESIRRRLEREGVRFVAGRADPARRVHWDELARRARKPERR